MSLTGSLEDLPLPDILQIVSLSKRTGILTVEGLSGRGVIIFKNGLVVSAISPSKKRKTLGQILLEQNIISSDNLEHALQYQKNIKYEPLGSILLKQNLLSYETLQKIVKGQIYEAIYDLLNFREGNFSFELSEIMPFDDIRCNIRNIAILEKGLNPQEILLDTIRIKDEEDRFKQTEDKRQDQEIKEIRPAAQAFIDKMEEEKISQQPPPSELELSIVPIVIVDDDAIVRKKIYKDLLTKGYDVFESNNIGEAEELIHKMQNDGKKFGVIADLLLPSLEGNGILGGLELIQYTKALSNDIPVIVITEYVDENVKELLAKNNISTYFIKPNIKGLTLEQYNNNLEDFAQKVADSVIEFCRKVYPEKYKEPDIPLLWQELGLDAPFTKEDIEMSKDTKLEYQLAQLQRVLEELKDPNEAPEISLIILKYATEFFDRGILFLLKDDEAVGLGGFGETGDDEPMPIKVRRIKIPLNERSIFLKIQTTKLPHKGKLPGTAANRNLIKMLGNLMPTEVALLPLISYGKVIAVLFGDNARNRTPLGNINALDIFMSHAGVAMENALLHKRINTLRIT
ncbi:MAG: hypothetical protein A2Y62_12280 [Candidatus Fischerbacteria bacterium RBG_13_37_8]|uniref:Response regulatory domain-containing protein n=1 Tax=Candidatus Fischerbacteria bacterium RBG_13_37_8 TaxID=1817863 RepID=A0A1F5VDE8_9BACT|nr:MAG: hypothetical protein A2Y62_12280 [Candidatus Fischerbacteria bacterium RBG_13_37_8]